MSDDDYETHAYDADVQQIATYCRGESRISVKPKSGGIGVVLSGMPFPDDIKAETIRVYEHMNLPNHRSGRFKRILYSCVYEAHMNLGRTCNPHRLKLLIGLKHTIDMSSVYSLTSRAYVGGVDHPLQRRQLIGDFLVEFFGDTRLPESEQAKLVSFGQQVGEMDRSLSENFKPQLVAAAIILVYLEQRGVTDLPKFVDCIGSSASSIDTMRRRVKHVASPLLRDARHRQSVVLETALKTAGHRTRRMPSD